MPNYDINPNLAGKLPPAGIAHLRELLSINLTNNTADADKPVSSAMTTQLNLKANLASPNFSGVPTLAGEPLATQAYATAAAGNSSVNKYAVHSAFGEGLIDMVVAKSGKGASGANIFYFSTNKTGDVAMAVGSSTGYVLPILFDGSTGTQAGDGNNTLAESLTFHPGGVNYTTPRAAGVMSVANGATTQSGTISAINVVGNHLTHLSLTGLTSLTSLICDNNDLTELDVSSLSGLQTLICYSNRIASLDTSALTALTYVDVRGNPITTLEVSNSQQLAYLDCNSCALTQVAVDGLLTDVYVGSASNPSKFDVSGGTNSPPTFASTTTLAGSNFSGSGTTCTVNHTAHGYVTGNVLQIKGVTTLTNANKYATITKVNDNQYTFTIDSQTATGGGTATINKCTSTMQNLFLRGWDIATN